RQAAAKPAVILELDLAAMFADSGCGYMGFVKSGPPRDSDGGSTCIFTEDGKPLGPGHAAHADIRVQGKGAYSHWTTQVVYFSASDNSDPRTNGRKYALVRQRP